MDQQVRVQLWVVRVGVSVAESQGESQVEWPAAWVAVWVAAWEMEWVGSSAWSPAELSSHNHDPLLHSNSPSALGTMAIL